MQVHSMIHPLLRQAYLHQQQCQTLAGGREWRQHGGCSTRQRHRKACCHSDALRRHAPGTCQAGADIAEQRRQCERHATLIDAHDASADATMPATTAVVSGGVRVCAWFWHGACSQCIQSHKVQ